MRSCLEPVNQTSVGVLNTIAVPRQRFVNNTLVHDELHALHTAAEVGVEVSGDRGKGDFVLLIASVLGSLPQVEGVSENTVGGEESSDEHVPV